MPNVSSLSSIVEMEMKRKSPKKAKFLRVNKPICQLATTKGSSINDVIPEGEGGTKIDDLSTQFEAKSGVRMGGRGVKKLEN